MVHLHDKDQIRHEDRLNLVICGYCTIMGITYYYASRVEAGIMGLVILWDAVCNFNAVILNQSIFNCLITSATTCTLHYRKYTISTEIHVLLVHA